MSPSATPRCGALRARLVMVMVDLGRLHQGDRPARSMQLARARRRVLPVDGRRHRDQWRAQSSKFVGDGCLAVFDESQAAAAVGCVRGLSDPVRALGSAYGVASTSAQTCTSRSSSTASMATVRRAATTSSARACSTCSGWAPAWGSASASRSTASCPTMNAARGRSSSHPRHTPSQGWRRDR